MIFLSVLCKHVELKACELDFKKDPKKLVLKKIKDLESTCIDPSTYILKIENVCSIGRGVFVEGVCNIRFPVRIEAKVFEPIVGEIIETRVSHIKDFGAGLFAFNGPLDVFVPSCFIPNYFIFEDGKFNSRFTNEKIGIGSVIRVFLEKYATSVDKPSKTKNSTSMMWVARLV